MSVIRFMAPGPWITRDLKMCVRASDYDDLEVKLLQARSLLMRYQRIVIQPDDSAHDSLWDDTARFLAPQMAANSGRAEQ